MIILAVACSLVAIGLYGTLTRRDIVAVLASVEVMMAGALLLLVTLGAAASDGAGLAAGVEAIGLIVLVVAAAEAAVGFALLVALARRTRHTRVEEITEVRG